MTRHREPRFASDERWWHHVIPVLLSGACLLAAWLVLQPLTSCEAERDPPPLTTQG